MPDVEQLELLHEAERALAAWAVGDADALETLRRACAGFARDGRLTCALVYVDGSALDVLGSPDAERRPDLLRRVALVASRDFITPGDTRWSGIVGADVELIPSVTPWIACEPVLQGPGLVQSVLVVIGGDDTPRDVSLSALIRLARWCGVVLAKERIRHQAMTLHRRTTQAAASLNLQFHHLSTLDLADAQPILDEARNLGEQLSRHLHDMERTLPDR